MADLKGIKKVYMGRMTREEWLIQRRKTLGGSDAAAIVGLSQYASPYTVWADKTGRLPDKPDSEAMREGRDLEDYVAHRWAEETGKTPHRLQYMLYNPMYPHSHADIDRAVRGERAGLECKTTSTLDVAQFKGVEFPIKYYAQCVHYLAVTGWDRWYLAVLVYGRGFYTYTLERDQAEIDALMEAENDFWASVANDTPPALDGSDATTEAIKTVYAEDDGSQIELFGRESMLDDLAELKSSKAAIDKQIKQIENVIKGDMAEATTAICGPHKITWTAQQRKSFDLDRFQGDHPEMNLSGYMKVSCSRQFRVKTTKNKEEK